MRYKYQQIIHRCDALGITFTLMHVGHSLYEWNWTSGESLIGLSKTNSAFNVDSMLLQFRKIFGVLVTTFEQMPLQRLVVMNGLAGKMSLNEMHVFSKILKRLSEFFVLRYLPGTFTNGFVMYNYWFLKQFNRIRNEQSREWRAFNRNSMIKVNWAPDFVILLGASDELQNLAREIDQLLIPSVVLLDSNTAPAGTFYPLRASDNNTRIFRYLLLLFHTCMGFGKELAFHVFEKYLDTNKATILQKGPSIHTISKKKKKL